MTGMPVLETERLVIRPFVMYDLADVHRLLDAELRAGGPMAGEAEALARRAQWLQWTVLNYEQLAYLRQPPYGDRGVVLKSTGQLIGACGFVPCLGPLAKLPGFSPGRSEGDPSLWSAGVGLCYAVAPAHQRCGYATEAAQALVDHAWQRMHLSRVIAMTTHDNVAEPKRWQSGSGDVPWQRGRSDCKASGADAELERKGFKEDAE
jgi:RimJ/RimL family protein N-acetyltransferase